MTKNNKKAPKSKIKPDDPYVEKEVAIKPELKAEEVEAPKVEAEELEAEEVEAPKVEAEEVEAPKVEAEEVEAPKLEAEELEAEKLEAEEVEAPKLEAEELEAEKPIYKVIKDYEFSVQNRKVNFKKGTLIRESDICKIFVKEPIFNYMMSCTKLKDSLEAYKDPLRVQIKKDIKDKDGNIIKKGVVLDLNLLLSKISKSALNKFRKEKKIMEIKNVQD